jgi:hypothetical protein
MERLSKNQFKQQGAVKYLEELIQLLATTSTRQQQKKIMLGK